MDDYVISDAEGLKPLTGRALPRVVNYLQERIGIPKWTAHILRRTFATQFDENLNIDPVVIEKCLGLKMPKIMATCNKNEMLPQREKALEKWSDLVFNMTYPHSEIKEME